MRKRSSIKKQELYAWAGIIIIVVGAITLFWWAPSYKQQKLARRIFSFEECERTGFPVSQGKDPKCALADGRVFAAPPSYGWPVYKSERLGLSIKYNTNISRWDIEEYGFGTLDFNGQLIQVESIGIMQFPREEQKFTLRRTTDPKIIEYIKQGTTVTDIIINTASYQRLDYTDGGYGYFTQRGDTYYLFESMLDASHDLFDEMMQTVIYK